LNWSTRAASTWLHVKKPQGAQTVKSNAKNTKDKYMALVRNSNETVVQRVQSDTAFAHALLDEAATLFLNGEPEPARLILRDLVNATMGFEQLATLTAKPSKSLHRMLSPTGNPSMDNLAAIFRAIRDRLQVSFVARAVAV
jgi:DNA-binding phage protein